jgi:hypothetical protein
MVYGMTLACEQIERLAKSSSREDASEGRQERRGDRSAANGDASFAH